MIQLASPSSPSSSDRIPALPPGIKLIGVHGRAGVGKDSVANYLQFNYYDVWREAFADPLKEAAAAAFGMPVDDFHDPDIKEVNDPFWGVSPRMIAQFFGTELFREQIWKLLPADQQDFWVRRMAAKLAGQIYGDAQQFEAGDTIVITDLRFQNEANYIVENGGIIILLTRPGIESTVGIPSHASENQTIHTPKEITFEITNDGTLEDLYARVEQVLEEANIVLTAKPE